MSTVTIKEIAKRQRAFFDTGATLSVDFRIRHLKKLRQNIYKYERELFEALNKDLGKSEFDAFTGEIGLALKEITFHIKNLRHWAKPEKVSTPLFSFPSKSYIHKQPFGKILIIAPFNFPFMLSIIPLIGAISAGNVAVVKPSELTTHVSAVIEKIIAESFDSNYVAVVQGGVEISSEILAYQWDKIFFTGSTRVGKIIMEAAAKHLTPVILELGGKNPVVVDEDANLKTAARRIAWGKFYNTGQSCVSPDYLFIHEKVKDAFLPLLKEALDGFYEKNPRESRHFGRMINESAVQRLTDLLKNENIFLGGEFDSGDRYFSPTILTDVDKSSPVMQDEIFGPVLPVISFNDLKEVVQYLNQKEKPLVVYYFSENRKKQKQFLRNTYSGDASINEVVVHFTNFALPFGGVGYSGTGAYHGKHSFDAFSHSRSVMKTTTWFDIPFRYAPNKKWILRMMRFLMK